MSESHYKVLFKCFILFVTLYINLGVLISIHIHKVFNTLGVYPTLMSLTSDIKATWFQIQNVGAKIWSGEVRQVQRLQFMEAEAIGIAGSTRSSNSVRGQGQIARIIIYWEEGGDDGQNI